MRTDQELKSIAFDKPFIYPMLEKATMKVVRGLLIFVLLFLASEANANLQVDFYKKTCPQAEHIIMEEMKQIMSIAPSIGAPFLRMYFHDCFVRGCDASVLLNTTDVNNPAERESIPNLSLRGWGGIDRIKAKLEKACPGTVSCADIIAIVARDAVVLSEGPYYQVPTGRRDGRVSISGEVLANLPPFFANISILKASFQAKGLSVKDLVVLSGAHTLGTSHCSSFESRIYNFTGRGDTSDVDPALDKNYIPRLRSKCKPGDQFSRAELTPGSFRTFDVDFYQLVSKRRGLFQSDAALLDDDETRAYVLRQARNTKWEFFKDFGESMVNMGNIEVLTGNQGEVRKHCAFVN